MSARRIVQRAGLLELRDHNSHALWVCPDLISSIRPAFPEENQCLLTVAGGSGDLQVNHSLDELLEVLEAVRRVKP